jgi:hypothetical protein
MPSASPLFKAEELQRTMQRKEAYTYVIAYNVVRAVINPIRLI